MTNLLYSRAEKKGIKSSLKMFQEHQARLILLPRWSYVNFSLVEKYHLYCLRARRIDSESQLHWGTVVIRSSKEFLRFRCLLLIHSPISRCMCQFSIVSKVQDSSIGGKLMDKGTPGGSSAYTSMGCSSLSTTGAWFKSLWVEFVLPSGAWNGMIGKECVFFFILAPTFQAFLR